MDEYPIILNKGKRIQSRRCKECIASYKNKHYHDNIDKYLNRSKSQREKDRDRYKTYQNNYREVNKDILEEKRKAYYTSETGREKNKIRSREYRSTEEGKYKDNVRSLVAHAVRSGVIIRPNNCSACNKEVFVEAHHEDYEKPLEVIWLCKKCHEIKHHLNEEHKSS